MRTILIIAPEKCTGCRMCEMYCSLRHTDTCNPVRSRVNVLKWDELGIMVPVMCQHCREPVCALVCPVNAIKKDEKTGLVATDPDLCISCLMCTIACPLGGPSLDPVNAKVIRCDMCLGKEEPVCAQVCPTEAIKSVTMDRVGLAKRREAIEALSKLMGNIKIL